MDIQSQLADAVRQAYAKVLSYDRTDLVSILNKNGFPVSNSSSDTDIINKSFQAIQISNDFRTDLATQLKKYAEHFTPFQSSKMNFAAQDVSGSYTNVLTGRDLTTKIAPSETDAIFLKSDLFKSNCNGFASFEGDKKNSIGDNVLDIAKGGISYLAEQQQANAAQSQADTALAIERAKIQAIQAQTAAENAKSSGTASILKAYTVPMIVGGIVVVGAIAAYFYFKKKKVS
jgi:hypothetical protein